MLRVRSHANIPLMSLKNAKRKGSKNERRSIALLEASGYACTKAAASLGVFDIVCIGSTDFIAVQVKATERAFPKETSHSFEWPCNQRDLDYWLQGNAPVVLIVVRPRHDEAYWVPLKAYFADLATRATRRIIFDKSRNRFDEACASELTTLAIPTNIGIYGPPASIPEKLYLNLLPVAPPPCSPK